MVKDAGDRTQFDLEALEPEILHPFVGFVLNPASTDESWRRHLGEGRPPINAMGFYGPEVELPSPSSAFHIWVVGGSVAYELAQAETDALLAAAEAVCAGLSQRPQLHCLALQGFKQPQQLQTLAYFAALGARLDCVINLDGFNDVALHGPENHGVCISFPRSWVLRSRAVRSRRAMGLLGEAAVAERISTFLDRRAWTRVPARSIITALREFTTRRIAAAAQASIAAHPPLNRPAAAPAFEALADLWYRSSLAIHKLVVAHGGLYVHALQPNQYDEGSKTLCAEEVRDAFNPTHPYRDGVLHGYPLLRRRGRDLLRDGVRFLDLSYVFRDEPGHMYVDSCCHLTAAGNRLVVQEVAKTLQNALISSNAAAAGVDPQRPAVGTRLASE